MWLVVMIGTAMCFILIYGRWWLKFWIDVFVMKASHLFEECFSSSKTVHSFSSHFFRSKLRCSANLCAASHSDSDACASLAVSMTLFEVAPRIATTGAGRQILFCVACTNWHCICVVCCVCLLVCASREPECRAYSFSTIVVVPEVVSTDWRPLAIVHDFRDECDSRLQANWSSQPTRHDATGGSARKTAKSLPAGICFDWDKP